MNDLFYSNMFSVISQWSDFRVSKNLYRAYFDLQKQQNSSSSSKETEDEKKVDTSKLNNTAAEDKLGSVSSSVTAAYAKLKTAIEPADGKKFDFDAAYNTASSFVNSYNDMISMIGKSGNSAVSGKASYTMSMVNSYASSMEDAGITINEDGTLKLDKETFMGASEDQLKAVFTGKSSFGSFVNETAGSIYKYSQSSAYKEATSAASTTNTTYNSKGAVTNPVNNSLTSSLLDYLI